MNFIKRTHVGLDYASVEVYDEHGNTTEYEVNKHIGDAINNMQSVPQISAAIKDMQQLSDSKGLITRWSVAMSMAQHLKRVIPGFNVDEFMAACDVAEAGGVRA